VYVVLGVDVSSFEGVQRCTVTRSANLNGSDCVVRVALRRGRGLRNLGQLIDRIVRVIRSDARQLIRLRSAVFRRCLPL